jgi:uncharacterized membrane protein YadS
MRFLSMIRRAWGCGALVCGISAFAAVAPEVEAATPLSKVDPVCETVGAAR